jgi:hypothetical protein
MHMGTVAAAFPTVLRQFRVFCVYLDKGNIGGNSNNDHVAFGFLQRLGDVAFSQRY